ncbi:phage tail assembly chaperone [Mesorhizobium sp. ASY16-5R]|uniref:phage tail assembly chaperone n=1 Tax=Mesorhizobium sp. ASY16-5R TaxID=3445772 RepID=UPI003FA11C29
MSSALGILKWSPNTFWQATFYEYTAAMKGHLVSQGVEIKSPMSRDEYLTLKAEDAAKTKRMPNA